jgi:hypothetical protein
MMCKSMILAGANKAEATMARFLATLLVLLAGHDLSGKPVLTFPDHALSIGTVA